MSVSSQKGFTLLELMVAMAIFAVLAVAGWQIFDSINRSKDRAEVQMDVLTDLQYGYQQIQRDMIQVVDYKIVTTNAGISTAPTLNDTPTPDNTNESQGTSATTDSNSLQGAFSLLNNRLSFIRHADPDPRYAQSASFERIAYLFDNGNLIRERYTTINDNSNEKPLRSIIVSNIENGSFQALLPEPSIVFPDSHQSPSLLVNQEDAATHPPKVPDLPKGITVNFKTLFGNVETPIEWVYALPGVAPQTHAAKSVDPDDRNDPVPEE